METILDIRILQSEWDPIKETGFEHHIGDARATTRRRLDRACTALLVRQNRARVPWPKGFSLDPVLPSVVRCRRKFTLRIAVGFMLRAAAIHPTGGEKIANRAWLAHIDIEHLPVISEDFNSVPHPNFLCDSQT